MVRVEYHAQAHNTMSIARARTLESSAVTMGPPRGLASLGGLTRQSNEKPFFRVLHSDKTHSATGKVFIMP